MISIHRTKVTHLLLAALTVIATLLTGASPASAAGSPSAPTNLTITTLTENKLVLSWKAPTNTGGSPIVDYLVSYKYPDPGVTAPVYYLVRDGKSSKTSVTIYNLNLKDRFPFSIIAVNSSGYRSKAANITVTTLTPPRPVTTNPTITKEMDFVYKYWNDRTGMNHKYMYIKANNCTNWISQVLHHGYGIPMDKHWYYHSTSRRSPSWTSQTALYNYMRTYHKEWKMYTDKEMAHATIGTYISFDWYPNDGSRNHGAIVTYIQPLSNGKHNVYYAGSTTHSLYRSVKWVTSVRRPQGTFAYFVPPNSTPTP